MSDLDYHPFGLKEFEAITAEFKNAQKGSFFTNFFIDYRPSWRETRYKIVLDSLKKAFPEKSAPLLNVIHKTKGSYEKRYINFIKTFRALYSKSLNDSELLDLLHKVVRHLFLRINYLSFTDHLVNNMEKAGLQHAAPKILEGNFIDCFTETWQGLQKAPFRLKVPLIKMISQFFRGQFNINFDPFCQENTPYHLFSIDKTDFIRMGTPTHEKLFSCITHKAYVNEEFHAFLESYMLKKEKHLYINLQNRLSGCPGYNESPRCLALENLALHYPENLVIITLNKNGSLWHQDGKFLILHNSRAFKDAIIDDMLGKKGGYHFSHHIHHSSLNKLTELIHEEFFASRHVLSLEERKDFIELLYTHIIEYLLETMHPDSVNITCKDGIDRAGTSSALYFVYHHLKRKGSLSAAQIAHLKTILFAPALLVKKRPPTYERFRRFQSCANRLLNHYNMRQA